jgi:type VI secretion system protein VasD
VSQHLSFITTRRSFALSSASLVLAACGGKPIVVKPKVLTIDVLAAANLNPSVSGRPSPVVVRVYELKASAPFEAADFVSLFDKDQSVLGGDLVARDEFALAPGESMAIKRDLGVGSKFIAVMVAFRDLERAKWRAVVPLVAGSDNALSVRLDMSTVRLAAR